MAICHPQRLKEDRILFFLVSSLLVSFLLLPSLAGRGPGRAMADSEEFRGKEKEYHTYDDIKVVVHNF